MTLLQNISKQLEPFYDAAEAKSLALWLIEEYFTLPYPILLQQNLTPTPAQLQDLQQIITRLQNYEPIQYVFGKTYWRGLELRVTKDVLIPRPETSELIDWILQDYNQLDNQELHVLDCCTGSGCIAIALKKARSDWYISALDISFSALQLAQQNADNQGVEIQFWQEDVLKMDMQECRRNIAGKLQHCYEYDILVCNPPYIMEREKAEMEENVLQYEPHNALFVPDNDPLLFYRSIAQQHLAPVLYFEIDHLQGKVVCELLQGMGYKTELRKDMQGKDRMVKAMVVDN